MGFKDLMGTLSPVYGAISGEGAMGKLLNPSEAARIAKEESDKVAAAEQQQTEARMQKAGTTMKKGGKVSSASSRADGCAQRGKTKGRMV
tara:strand:- start:276 stop:545 length:270 start_codon:yes stop_codon:yes gene_type:complete